jgi:hypothetical protein
MSSQRHTGIKTFTISTTHTNCLCNQCDWAGRKRGPIRTTHGSVENRLLDRVWTFFGPCVRMIAGGITTTCGRNSRGV